MLAFRCTSDWQAEHAADATPAKPVRKKHNKYYVAAGACTAFRFRVRVYV